MSPFLRKLTARLLAFSFIPALLIGCGESNDPAPASRAAPLADHASVSYVRGVVTSAHPDSGTILVGDDEVTIADATVSQNGVIVADAQPKVGDTVSLIVRRDAKGEGFVAQAIDLSIVAQGPIEAVNPALNTFTILGQSVSYSPTTVVGLPVGSTLTAGMVVRVSGSVAGAGRVTATRVDYVSASYTAGTQVQVTGLVQGLNATTRTFSLGNLRVNYANIALTTTLLDNMTVVVGATALPVAGTLTATELSTGSTGTVPGTPTSTIDSTITMRGPIELVNLSASTFNVMGQTVSYNSGTIFPSGVTGTVLLGYVVKVTAAPSTIAGQWIASRVELVSTSYVQGSPVQVSGTVQNVNTSSRTFALGNLTVSYGSVVGSTVTPANGMSIIVGATSTPIANSLTATELRAGTTTLPTNPIAGIDTSAAIKGPIESVNVLGGTFVVMGQTVTFNTATQFPNLQANTLVLGYVVKVTATPGTVVGQWTATRVDLVSTSYVAGTPVQVSGTISSVNTLNRSFTLGTAGTVGALTVSYATLTNLTFTPTVGMSVIVGATATPVGGTLTATEMVTTAATTPGIPGTTLDPAAALKGPIESVNVLGGTFNVMGQTVTFNGSTIFPNGQQTTLVQGYVVRVVATAGAVAGQWTAARVELVSTSYVAGTPVQVSGMISSVNTLNRSFTLGAVGTVGALTVSYATVTNLTLTPAVGVSVIVGAVATPVNGTLTAREIVQSSAANPGTPGLPAGIDVSASLIGPVEAINATAGSFTVLGQTVSFSGTTQFVTNTGTTFILTAGNVVKVTTTPGTFVGQLIASRVELVSNSYVPGTPVQVSGTVQNVNTLQRTFNLGTLTVNYAGVLNLTFTPTAGMNVIAASTSLPVANVFSATAMTPSSTTIPGLPGTLPGVGGQPTVAVVTGTITSVLSTTEFSLTGVTVRVTPATQFLNGSAALMLPGMSVMVTGTLSGGLPNAFLDATIIRFSGSPIAGASRVQIRGPIEWIDLPNRRLSVLGVTVTMPVSSIFVRDDDPDHSVNLANLQPGMVVTVAGMGTNRQLNATFVGLARGDGRPRASDDDDDFQSRLPSVGTPLDGGIPNVGVTGVRAWMWAPLEAVTPPTLSAFGIPVATTASTAFFPAGHRSRAGSPDAFFTTASTGRTVRVEGIYTSTGTFVATRVCIVNSIRGSAFDDNDSNRANED